MRAVVVERYGGSEVLKVSDRAEPQAGPGQILVDVAAAGVNFMDIYRRQGAAGYAGALPYVPGEEGAGTVVAIGPDVREFVPGDRVAWADAPGSYAERLVIPAGRAVPVAHDVDLKVAAAVMLQGMTAHYLTTDTYPVREGDPVVVHAAAGGVGLLLTQMVRMRGGVVTGTTSTAEKAELARNAGVDQVTDYNSLVSVVREATGGRGAAVVYDGVGRATFDSSLDCLRPRGYLVVYGAASGPVPPFDLRRLMTGGSLFLTRPTLRNYISTRRELLHRAGDLFSWIRQGRLTVRIGGTYPLSDAKRAHDDLAARRTTGKLLLLPT
jgi:NADPH2:quinone reductase